MPTNDIHQAFETAMRHHQAGQLQKAEQLYRQILQAEPRHSDALHLLGVIAHQVGKHDVAITFISQALRLSPQTVGAHNNLGLVYTRLGRFEDAVASFREALRLQPTYATAHNNLGLVYTRLNRFEDAVASFREALRLQPAYPEALNNLGIVFTTLDRLEEAAASCQQALRLKSDFPEAHNQFGLVLSKQGLLEEASAHYREALQRQPDYAEAHGNLSSALLQMDRPQEALAHAHEAVRLRPDLAEAHGNLGTALAALRRAEEAVPSFREAIRLGPELAIAHNNFGNALRDLGRLDEATASLQQALRLRPDYAEARSNLGIILKEAGRLDEALACLGDATRLNPNLADAHLTQAIIHLLRGDFVRGWPGYEWRWKCWGLKMPSYPQPLWDGAPLAGRTILLWAEQGLGDTLQFVRYAPLVQQRGGKVLLSCPPRLVRLLNSVTGIDRVVSQDDPLPAFDVHAPLLSLPGIFRTSLDTIPARMPYLRAEVDLIERWGRELAQLPGRMVGITWRGNPKNVNGRYRSMPLTSFEALARVPGVTLISLQKGPGTEELAQLGQRFRVHELAQDVDAAAAFVDTAAIMHHLDLVVTTDTSMAHLAGALDVPVWVALPYVSDWRWLLEREDTPWYPTMRLFRQNERGEWPAVFERMAAEMGPMGPMGPMRSEQIIP